MRKLFLYRCFNSKIGNFILIVSKPIFNLLRKNNIWKKYKAYNYMYKYDKQELNHKLALTNNKFILIDAGLYNYNYFNFAFMNNMLSLIIYNLQRGYFPIIHLKDREKGWMNWNTFFSQPFDIKAEIADLQVCPVKDGDIKPWFNSPFIKDELKLWSKVYNDFMVFNDETREYVQEEYNKIIKPHKRVMGVLYRGTDYLKLKPKGHPIQPSVEVLIAEVKSKMIELGIDKIYLATEEYKIVEVFEQEFPGQILLNKRKYYDEVFYSNNLTVIGEVGFERENDTVLKGLEYLSSIYLLSKCDALIAGNTGGSSAALFLNNKQYEYWKLFDLGYYGVEK